MQPGARVLDDLAEDAQAGVVRLASIRDHGADASLPEQATVLVVVVVIAAVSQQRVGGLPTRPATADILVEQRLKSGTVVAVSARQRHRERYACP